MQIPWPANTRDVPHRRMQDRRSGSIRRRLRLFSIVLLAAVQFGAFVDAVQAAKFDEKIKAPHAPSNAELQAVIRDYFETYARVNAEVGHRYRERQGCIPAVVRDELAPAARDRQEASRSGDLSEFGLTPNGDGSYSVDLAEFPQWDPLPYATRTAFGSHKPSDSMARHSRTRGFRDQDIEAMRAYVEKSPRATRRACAELDIAEGYCRQGQGADCGETEESVNRSALIRVPDRPHPHGEGAGLGVGLLEVARSAAPANPGIVSSGASRPADDHAG